MLAFLDNPVGLIVLMVAILVLFGPDKLPEIGMQLGKALRDFKRATSEFSNQLNLDDDRPAAPYQYDSSMSAYNSAFGEESADGTPLIESSPESRPYQPEDVSKAAETKPVPHSDFAASAFNDNNSTTGG